MLCSIISRFHLLKYQKASFFGGLFGQSLTVIFCILSLSFMSIRCTTVDLITVEKNVNYQKKVKIVKFN